MKALLIPVLFLGLAACASNMQRAEQISWPDDPAERQVAERYLAKAEAGAPGTAPPQLEFTYRNVDGRLVADHFDYQLDRLEAEEIITAFRTNVIGNYVDELRAEACADPEARYLLDRGFDFEFLITLKGGKGDKTAREKMNKGFCVASELPLVDREAVTGRHNMVRYWPNGERVDIRLLEQLTGTFRLIAARPEQPEMIDPNLEVTAVAADGLDGLAIVPVMIAAASFALIAYLVGNAVFSNYLQIQYVPGSGELTVFCGALIGASLGFLWFNAPPAMVFMGDTGSLAMGGALGSISLVARHEIVLAIIGGLFVLETVSVIVQVASYKMTGKRVFRMAPLHHHFEQKGWAEPTIVIRFWIIAVILALIGLASLKLR